MVVGLDELSVPLKGNVDAAAERKNLQKELEYTRCFMASVEKKLQNKRFGSSAPPQVVESEHKNKTDAEARIKALEESLAAL